MLVLVKDFLGRLIAEFNFRRRFSHEDYNAFSHPIDQIEVFADLYAKARVQFRYVLQDRSQNQSQDRSHDEEENVSHENTSHRVFSGLALLDNLG